MLAGQAQLDEFIDQFYAFELSVDGILREIETGEVDYQSIQQESGDEYTQPIVRLVGALLVDAVKRGASDLHFEPEYAFLRVRYRIDGVLEQIRSLHKNYWPGIAVRLKVISGMNIAETRAPQDGRISLNISGHPIDFRVAAQPTIHGENLVLRILDRQKGIVPLDQIGLEVERHADLVQRHLHVGLERRSATQFQVINVQTRCIVLRSLDQRVGRLGIDCDRPAVVHEGLRTQDAPEDPAFREHQGQDADKRIAGASLQGKT